MKVKDITSAVAMINTYADRIHDTVVVEISQSFYDMLMSPPWTAEQHQAWELERLGGRIKRHPRWLAMVRKSYALPDDA